MENIILSRHFSKNTKLVANLCRKCYTEEEDVLVCAVNLKFLEKYDLEHYKTFKNNFIVVPKQIKKFKEKKPNEKYQALHKTKVLFVRKRRILKKYFRISSKLYNSTKRRSESEENKLQKDEAEENCLEPLDTKKREKLQGETCENSVEIEPEMEESFSTCVKWIPPISPHNLIEERYYYDPWALLVVTIFLNKTTSLLAVPCMEKFFDDFKGPYDVLKVDVQRLEPYFSKIGFVRLRAARVWRMSHDFVHKDWKSAGELYGIGKYGEDAYRMFCLGDFTVQPSDRYLKIYKRWYEMKTRNENLGVVETNSQVYLEDYYVEGVDEDRQEVCDV